MTTLYIVKHQLETEKQFNRNKLDEKIIKKKDEECNV